jgi:hypothetical protein
MVSPIQAPIIIIGAPRSGTTLLFTILGAHPELFSLYEESRFIFRDFYLRQEKQKNIYPDDALLEISSEEIKMIRNDFHKTSFRSSFLGKAYNKVFRKHLRPIADLLYEFNALFKNLFYPSYRLLEKTPRNCFKIPVIKQLFPDAYFVYITRDPRSNISSLIEGWRNRPQGLQYKRSPELSRKINFSNFDAVNWRFVLPPGWESYADKSLEELCAYQWLKSNEYALNDLPKDRTITIRYEDLCSDPLAVTTKICEFTKLSLNKKLIQLATKPPEVNYLDSKPQKDKWLKNKDAIDKIMPMVKELMDKLGYSK